MGCHDGGMLSFSGRSVSNLDVMPLELVAERAGAALACAYSSSAEYDAELIAERRAAGVYGPKRHRRRILATGAGIAAGLAVIVFFII
jgi:hypothetical protein